jgi:hypothetical protein
MFFISSKIVDRLKIKDEYPAIFQFLGFSYLICDKFN